MSGIRHDNKFKHDAVTLIVKKGKSVSEVSREVGISSQTLKNWLNAHEKKIYIGKFKINELECKLKEKQKKIEDLEQSVEILKKAVVLLAHNN